jgi:dolichol kinase
MDNLFYNQLAEFIFIHVLALLLGILVVKYNFRVNYSRKVIHFFIFFSPYIIRELFHYEETILSQITVALVGISTLAIYVKPVRNNVKIVSLMFATFDRPEDRPHSLRWLFTQYLATYLVALPLWLFFKARGHTEAIPIIILINAIGDGLAEPVGVTWGRHQYKVKAIFTNQLYKRSIEGSLCVFLTAVLVILAYHQSFNTRQFFCALAAVPITAMLAEAKSPHTWDSPFIFLFTGLALIGIYSL